MIIGDRIAHRLSELGISQAELARRVQIDQSTINGLVRGGAKSSRHLHRIARELQTTASFLTGETDDPTTDVAGPQYSAEEREWLELLRTLKPSDQKAALTMVRALALSEKLASLPVAERPAFARKYIKVD